MGRLRWRRRRRWRIAGRRRRATRRVRRWRMARTGRAEQPRRQPAEGVEGMDAELQEGGIQRGKYKEGESGGAEASFQVGCRAEQPRRQPETMGT
jgi:hypothetical protein